MQHDQSPGVDEILARQVAGETLIDVRTVRKYLRGERVRDLLQARIRAAMATRVAPAKKAAAKATR